MARASTNDLLQNFRFHVKAARAGDDVDILPFTNPEDGEAGFQSVTIPEVSADAVEYREGTDTWTRKYPGPPTVGSGSLMRGVAKEDTVFWEWMLNMINATEEFRCDLTIHHFSRDESPDVGGAASRYYVCYNCFPTRVKPAADLDSTSGDVSVAELDFELERVAVFTPGNPDGIG